MAIAENTVVLEYRLNYFSGGNNSNKVWIGRAYSDGRYMVEYGRVGGTMQSRTKEFGSQYRAIAELQDKAQEKRAKGYREVALETETGFGLKDGMFNTPLGPINRRAVEQGKSILQQLRRSYDPALVDRYYQLIPHDFGGRIPTNLLCSSGKIDRELDLLNSIDTALNPATKKLDAFAAADAAIAKLKLLQVG